MKKLKNIIISILGLSFIVWLIYIVISNPPQKNLLLISISNFQKTEKLAIEDALLNAIINNSPFESIEELGQLKDSSMSYKVLKIDRENSGCRATILIELKFKKFISVTSKDDNVNKLKAYLLIFPHYFSSDDYLKAKEYVKKYESDKTANIAAAAYRAGMQQQMVRR